MLLLPSMPPLGRPVQLPSLVPTPSSPPLPRPTSPFVQGSLLHADGPSLLQSLHLGPRLSLRLQSDFASHSVPLDIRAAVDGPSSPGWQWPWRRRAPRKLWKPLPPPPAAATAEAAPAEDEGPARRWWDWPSAAGTQ